MFYVDSNGLESYPFYEKDAGATGLVNHGGMIMRDPTTGAYMAYDFGPVGGASALPQPGHVRKRSGATPEEAAGSGFEVGEMIATTAEEDQALIDYWETLKSDPGTYFWFGRSCITECVNSMEAVLPGYWMFAEGFYTGWSWPGINASIRHFNSKRDWDEIATDDVVSLFEEKFGRKPWEVDDRKGFLRR